MSSSQRALENEPHADQRPRAPMILLVEGSTEGSLSQNANLVVAHHCVRHWTLALFVEARKRGPTGYDAIVRSMRGHMSIQTTQAYGCTDAMTSSAIPHTAGRKAILDQADSSSRSSSSGSGGSGRS